MKILFLSCLALLLALTNLQAAETYPDEITTIVSESLAKDKVLLQSLLSKISEETGICPKKLFSINLPAWEELVPTQYEKELRANANLINFLNRPLVKGKLSLK